MPSTSPTPVTTTTINIAPYDHSDKSLHGSSQVDDHQQQNGNGHHASAAASQHHHVQSRYTHLTHTPTQRKPVVLKHQPILLFSFVTYNTILAFLVVTACVWLLGAYYMLMHGGGGDRHALRMSEEPATHQHFDHLYNNQQHAPTISGDLSLTDTLVSDMQQQPHPIVHQPKQGAPTYLSSEQQAAEALALQQVNVADALTEQVTSYQMPDPAILCLTYNRPQYLEKTLQSLLGLHDIEKCSVYISQDGDDPPLTAMVEQLQQQYPTIKLQLVHHPRPALVNQPGTVYLAAHYKWALDQLMYISHSHSHVIIIEDDMTFSPDFLTYFQQTAVLLDIDPTLWCISSWNDLGYRWLIGNVAHDFEPNELVGFPSEYMSEHQLYRTDFFPGLGWMLRREEWARLRDKWPSDQWDWWIRGDDITERRQCIIPEVSRNHNIGEVGTNMGNSFYNTHLEPIMYSQLQPDNPIVQWTPIELLQLRSESYKQRIMQLTAHASAMNYVGNLHEANTQRYLQDLKSQAGDGKQPHKYVIDAAQIPPTPTLPAIYDQQAEGSTALLLPAAVHAKYALILYDREDYTLLSQILQLGDAPRSTYHGIMLIKLHDTLVVLADSRLSSYYLPVKHQWFGISPRLNVIAATAEGQDCNAVCTHATTPDNTAYDPPLKCLEDHWFMLNSCQLMQQYFKCEAGCRGGVVGDELPAYVSNNGKPELYQLCLTTDVSYSNKCGSSHWSTKRLCVCG